MMAHRADPAQALHQHGSLPERPPLDEPLKTAELDNVQASAGDIARVVELDRDLAMPLDAGDRLYDNLPPHFFPHCPLMRGLPATQSGPPYRRTPGLRWHAVGPPYIDVVEFLFSLAVVVRESLIEFEHRVRRPQLSPVHQRHKRLPDQIRPRRTARQEKIDFDHLVAGINPVQDLRQILVMRDNSFPSPGVTSGRSP